MTETSPGITTSPAEGWKYGSAGVPNPMTRVKVVDIETGAALGPNQEGEICCLGPQNMKGYLNNDKATRQTIDPDGWLHTGKGVNVRTFCILCGYVEYVHNSLQAKFFKFKTIVLLLAHKHSL